jgi:hypothetical protein
MWMRIVLIVVAGLSLVPAGGRADPRPDPDPDPPGPRVSALLLAEPTPRPVPSLRLEAMRVLGERFEGDWKLPEPEPLFGYGQGTWFVGYARYHPRSRRAGALHAGAVGATMIGGLLLGGDAKAVAAGALLVGATLDAAANDAEASHAASR